MWHTYDEIIAVKKELSHAICTPYRDLLMRYQGMKDYKKRPVISFFFNEYLRRIGNDPEIPHLIDIIAENGDY